LGQFESAIADFNAALRLNPQLASSLYGRGLARQRSGNAAAGQADIVAATQAKQNIAEDYISYGVR
jgi:tetratricopeptide (TPR) repeat protein